MKITMIYLLIVVFLCIIGTVLYLSTNVPKYDPVLRQVVVTGSTGKDIYIIEKVWGISANHRQILITDVRPNGTVITDTNYVFSGYTPFLYKFNDDTLYTYTQSTLKEKKPLSGGMKVEQIILSNPEMMSLLEEYEQYGLIRLGN